MRAYENRASESTKRFIDQLDPVTNRRAPRAVEMALAADVGRHDQFGLAALEGV